MMELFAPSIDVYYGPKYSSALDNLPANIYLFKVTIETVEKGVKYI